MSVSRVTAVSSDTALREELLSVLLRASDFPSVADVLGASLERIENDAAGIIVCDAHDTVDTQPL
jgi:hypothetical protein